MWAKFEAYLEESYPGQQVNEKLENLSAKVQMALISSFLLSKKMNYHTNNVLKPDWDYFLKKLNKNRMVYIDHRRGYVCQQEEAFKVITNIFNTLNSLISEPVKEDNVSLETPFND